MGLLARRGRLFLLFLVTLGVVLGFTIVLHSRHDWGRPIIPSYEGDDDREGLRDVVVKEGEDKKTEDKKAEDKKTEEKTPVVVEVDHSTHNHAQGWDAKQNTTIGYLARYVEGVQGGQECEEDYGMKFIRRWQSYGKDYCLPFDAEDPAIATSPSQWQFAPQDFRLQTKIRCHSLIPSHQTPEPNSVCLIERVVVDFGKLGVSICQGEGCHNDFYDSEKTVFFKPGVVRGHCRRVVSKDQGWNTNNLVKTVGNWLVRGWQDLDAAPAKELATEVCTKENTVDHFVYFVSRYDTTNLYHSSEDWIHAFSAFSVLEVPVENSQVIIADGLVPGPFLEVWKELYSRNHPVLSVHDLHKAGQTKCFRYMGANVFGAVSPLCKQVGRETPCGNSTLVRGFRDFFLASFKVKYLLPPEDKLTITIIQRKNYARATGPVQRISRQIQNHDQLVEMAKDMFPTAEVRSVDFAGLSFRDQLKLIRTTDILMGAHGAALSHMMFLPSTSVSIEFWIDDRYGNYHYVNMGKWLGITHLLEHQSNPLNLDQTRADLEEAAALVAKNKKRRLYDH